MDRRTFLTTLAAAAALRADPRRKVLFICMDGCGTDYLKLSDVPNLKRMMQAGMYREGRSVRPSVTNVNNSAIRTATSPSEHGINGNYYNVRTTERGTYMEKLQCMLPPT